MAEQKAFDPREKEAQLQRESQAWEIGQIETAAEGDIPLIDVSDYFASQNDSDLDCVARQLARACKEVGFWSMLGHGFPEEILDKAFVAARHFHELPAQLKQVMLMDQPQWPVGGVGYMPVNNRKLPARNKGNLNESLVFKRDHSASLEENHWPAEEALPGFRRTIENYICEIEKLALRLLPIYARALEMEKDFFAAAFTRPLYRMRLTRYPVITQKAADEFGIPPHVDTTFFTILAQKSPGLVIYSEQRRCWIHAPVLENAFIVNTGELLKQWSNHEFISVKHFADNNSGDEPRYSIPFFFNANADYPMACIPSCCSTENPARSPPISYLESQAIAQGE